MALKGNFTTQPLARLTRTATPAPLARVAVPVFPPSASSFKGRLYDEDSLAWLVDEESGAKITSLGVM